MRTNARAFLEVRDRARQLRRYLWNWVGGVPVRNAWRPGATSRRRRRWPRHQPGPAQAWLHVRRPDDRLRVPAVDGRRQRSPRQLLSLRRGLEGRQRRRAAQSGPLRHGPLGCTHGCSPPPPLRRARRAADARDPRRHRPRRALSPACSGGLPRAALARGRPARPRALDLGRPLDRRAARRRPARDARRRGRRARRRHRAFLRRHDRPAPAGDGAGARVAPRAARSRHRAPGPLDARATPTTSSRMQAGRRPPKRSPSGSTAGRRSRSPMPPRT